VYVARPLGDGPSKFALQGDRTDFAFQVPAGLSPGGNSFKLTVRPKGLERDAASPESPYRLPVQGLQVDQDLSIAAGVPFSGAKGTIAAARIFVAAKETAEVVMTVCADAAGMPGQPLGKPAVNSKVEGLTPQWIDLPLPVPIAATRERSANAANEQGILVVVCRCERRRCAVLTSTDKGKTWGAPSTPLAAGQNLLAQLMSPSDQPPPTPAIRLQREADVLNTNLLAGATAPTDKKKDISVPAVSLPASLLADSTVNQGKVDKRFELASVTVADVTIENFELTYDPAAGA